MQDAVRIWLDMEPTTKTAQGRRWRCVAGHPQSYQPTEYKQYLAELDVALINEVSKPAEPIEGPVLLKAVFVYPYQKGDTKTKKQRESLEGTPFLPHATKPDWDNSMKAPQDALQAARYLADDSHVFHAEVSQYRGPKPGMMFEIIPFEGDIFDQNMIGKWTEELPR